MSATVPSKLALKSLPARLKLVARPAPSVPFAEPSVVASDVESGTVHAVGFDAERMIEMAPGMSMARATTS